MYAQWIAIKIENSNASEALTIKNVGLDWGKFHEGGNKDKEVGIEEIKKISIPRGQSETIYACGHIDLLELKVLLMSIVELLK